MVGLMEGFRVIEGDLIELDYWRRQGRALGLLCLTIVPMLIGRGPHRVWKADTRLADPKTASPNFTHYWSGSATRPAFSFWPWRFSFCSIASDGPATPACSNLLPGAAVATILWWAMDVSFGWYVRKMPYDVMYRGLASAIGLLIWMFLAAMIVLLGAAYNAEAREEREAEGRAESELTLVVP